MSDSDVEARLGISRDFLDITGLTRIGFEALQRKGSLSKSAAAVQSSKIRAIRRELSGVGVETFFSVHTPYTPVEEFSLTSEIPNIRRATIQAVKSCINLAEDVGARVVNTHPGGIVKTDSEGFEDPAVKRAVLDRLKESLVDLVDCAETRNVVLSVENLPYPMEELSEGYSPLIGVFPKDFIELVKEIDSKSLGVTIDFCHLWITYKSLTKFKVAGNRKDLSRNIRIAGYDGLASYESEAIESLVNNPFEDFTKGLCEKVAHVHVADSDGVYIPGKSTVYEGRPLGEGDLDLHALSNSLREIERCSKRAKRTMVVLEPKELNMNKPFNSLRSLLRLYELLKERINT